MNEKEVYEKQYVPGIVRIGRVIMSLALVIFFLPFLALWLIFGIQPSWPQILQASFARVLINAPWWVMEPLSYFPVLGIPGTFIASLAGNSSNMRMPCATAAQKAADTKPGTIQGQLIATIGVCVSVFINLIVLVIGVLLGIAVLSALPPEVTEALNFLLPALYGCVFAQFLKGNEFAAATAVGFALVSLLAYRAGFFNWMPFSPSILTMVIPIIGTVGLVYFVFRNKGEKRATTEEV